MSSTEEQPERDQLERRLAAREINGRQVNEAIARGSEDTGRAAFVCECGHLGCTETAELPTSAYEAVRSSFERFFVLPGHQIELVDRVVEDHGEYLVVVKREGEPREMARASDERTE